MVATSVVTLIPISASAADLTEYNNLGDNPQNYIGMGYNALSEKTLEGNSIDTISVNSIIKTHWIDIEKANAEKAIYTMSDGNSILFSEGSAFYSESSSKLLLDFGINYSTSASAKFPIKIAKMGVETKFNFDIDFSKETIHDELYYVYNYRAVMNQFSLNTTKYTTYLSDDFLTAVQKLSDQMSTSSATLSEAEETAIQRFFNTYGTHMLVSYEQGAAMTYTAWDVSFDEDLHVDANFASKVSGEGSVGKDIGISSAYDVNTTIKIDEELNKHNMGYNFVYYGGDKINQTALSDNMNDANLNVWRDSAMGKGVFLPETSEWASIWEILPDTEEYELIREKLKNYFLSKSNSVNTDFLARFCKFDERVQLNDMTYISDTGYVFKGIPLLTGSSAVNLVGSNSKIVLNPTVKTSLLPIEDIKFKIDSDFATIDDNNVISVSDVDLDEDKDYSFTLQVLVYGVVIKSIRFVIASEDFSGGYGEEYRPYIISESSQIVNIANDSGYADKHFMLVKDIDFGGADFVGIPTFSGVFDGNGYSVYNFKAKHEENNGFFSEIAVDGTVKNLTIGKAGVTTYDEEFSVNIDNDTNHKNEFAGGVAGLNQGTILNCQVINSRICAYSYQNTGREWQHSMAGGICGKNVGKIYNCYTNDCYVYAYMRTKNDGTPGKCHASAGGIAGRMEESGCIGNCVSSNNTIHSYAESYGSSGENGTVESFSGGILGLCENKDAEEKWITNCVSYGHTYDAGDNTDGKRYVNEGIIIGRNDVNGQVTNGCYGFDTTSTDADMIGEDYNGNNVSNPAGCIKVESITDIPDIENIARVSTGATSYILKPVSVERIIIENTKTQVPEGAVLDMTGITLTAKYTGNAPETNFANTSVFRVENFSSYNPEILGNKTLKLVTYAGQTNNLAITTIAKKIEKLSIIEMPNKTKYFCGEIPDITGLTLEVKYNNGATEIIENTGLITIVSFDTSTKGAKQAEVSYGGLSVSFDISVFEILPESIELAGSSEHKQSYIRGEAWTSEGYKFTVKYNNNTSSTVGTENITFTALDTSSEGNKTVKATYHYVTVDGESKTLSCDIALNVGDISYVEIESIPTKTTYFTSEFDTSNADIDLTGLVLKVTYTNGVVKYVNDGYTLVKNYNMSIAGEKPISVTYGEKALLNGQTFTIRVVEPEMTGIAITLLPKTEYYVGDTFTTSGMTLMRYYNDGSEKPLHDGYSFQIDGYEMNYAPTFSFTGSKNVNIIYIENNVRKTASYTYNVSPVILERIEVSQYKRNYKVGDIFKNDGMIVNAIYNNGKIEQVYDYTWNVNVITKDTTSVTIYYDGMSAQISISVVTPSRIEITSLPEKTTYEQFETLDISGLAVEAVYYDGDRRQLGADQYTIDIPQLNELGRIKVTVVHEELSAFFYVTVNEIDYTTKSHIAVDSRVVTPESTVKLAVNIQNNPGIAGIVLTVKYDTDALTLDSITNGSIMSTMTTGTNIVLNNTTNTSEDGVLVTLTFKANENAELGDYAIECIVRECSNTSLEAVTLYSQSGTLSLIDFVYGDADGNGLVNLNDAILVRTYLATYDYDTGESTTDVSTGADADGNGVVNLNDAVLLNTYLANYDYDTGSSNVILGPAA